MSTPDATGPREWPRELTAPAGHVPAPTATPTAATPTPGVALAGARVAGAPTLPEWDPNSLALLVGRLANDLFAAPPQAPDVSGDPPTALADGPAPAHLPAAPGMSVQSPPAPAPTSFDVPDAVPLIAAPSRPSAPPYHAPSDAPFSAPLRLDALVEPYPAPPGLDGLADALALIDPSASPSDAPYWLHSPRPPASAGVAPDRHELDPHAIPQVRPASRGTFDAHALKREFPILQQRVHGKPLVWLDNAATTQKPRAVIDRLTRFYEHENSNVHRAAHTLAARATDAYESARETVRRFLGAPSVRDIVFVRGATEGINLVAQSWGRRNVGPGDEIVVTWLEHHANIVPWQMLCAEKGARLRVAPVDVRGQIILEEYEKLLGPRTRLVALPQVSNALGTVTPAHTMVEMAHRHGARVLVDGAQSVSHMAVDVQRLGCDFFVLSGHKVFAPTGIGAVFARHELLDETPPWQGGGNMIQDVTFERTVYQPAPARFEAGTGNIADAVGLGAALDWLTGVGLDNVARHEHDLLVYATERLATVPGLTMIGTAPHKAGVLSFVLAGHKTEEVGGLLDKEGIAVRSGHHCAQPILRRFGLEATVRASLAPYNTCEDIDALVDALLRLQAGRAAPR